MKTQLVTNSSQEKEDMPCLKVPHGKASVKAGLVRSRRSERKM